MTGRVYAIALNTFREAVRDRVLYGVIGFATAVLAFTLALAELSLDQQMRVVTDLGLASISLFSVLVAIFLGSSLLYKEIERKTLYVILPKPIRRYEFLLGKYFGIVVTCVVFIALMGAIQLWVTAIQADASKALTVLFPVAMLGLLGLVLSKARDKTVVLVPWALVALAGAAWLCSTVDVELGRLLASLVLNVGEVLILTAVALLFSSFSTPFLTGVFTFGVWLVGRSAHDMVTMKSSVLNDQIKFVLGGLAEIVPNFNLFVPGYETLMAGASSLALIPEQGILGGEAFGGAWTYVGSTMGYAVLYASVVLFFAALIFRKRDFL